MQEQGINTWMWGFDWRRTSKWCKLMNWTLNIRKCIGCLEENINCQSMINCFFINKYSITYGDPALGLCRQEPVTNFHVFQNKVWRYLSDVLWHYRNDHIQRERPEDPKSRRSWGVEWSTTRPKIDDAVLKQADSVSNNTRNIVIRFKN